MGGLAGGGVSLGTLSVDITASVDEATRAIQGFASDVGAALGDESKWQALGNLGDKLSGIGTSLTLITAPFAALGATAITAAGDLEALTMALTSTTGSSEEAARQLARLKEIAKLPGLGLEEAVKGSIALQAVGIEAQTAERYLKAFGNAIAAAGGGKADLEAVVVQLRQMGATGKVTAEDLKPILERVPQVAAVTKEAFGTINTEELQKAGVTADQFLQTIVTGLEKIPPVAGGIKNSLENLGDSAKTSLAKIGEALVPALEKAVPLIEGFLTKVGDLATWFTNLPQPVQDAALALAGFAAALGPLLIIAGQVASSIAALGPAVGAAAAAIGVSAGALVLAIGAAIAALVALSVWVYSNWDAIVAVLTQAWESVEAIWNAAWTAASALVIGIWNQISSAAYAVWEPLASFFALLWEPISSAFNAAWTAIGGLLTGIWNGIKETAASVWGSITEVFTKALDWASKIPGVSDLINDLKQSAEKAATEINKTGDAAKEAEPKVTQLGGATGAVARKATAAKSEIEKMKDEIVESKRKADLHKQAMRELGLEVEKTGKEHTTAKTEVKKFNDEILLEKLRNAQTEHNKLVREIAAYETEARKAAGTTFDLNAEWDKLTATTNLGAAAIASVNVKLPVMNTDMDTAIQRTQALDGAFKTLGVTSSTEFAKVAADAAHARDIVLGSDQASDFDKQTAVYKALKAQVDAAKAAGVDIPAEQTAMLAKLKGELEQKVPEMKGPWEGLATSVSTVITNFAQDISKSLWDGEMSWGEKGKSLLKSLGQAVTSSFIEPATAAIGSFIKGALTDLLGSGGFGGVWDSIKGLGGAIGGIFGGGGGAKPPVPTLPTGGGGAGGGLGGMLGGSSGAWISGIGSAISGALSFIGSMRTEGTLNAIEKEVRYSQIHLFYILGDLNDFFHRDWWVLYGLVLDIKSAIVDSMEPQLARAAQKIDVLKQIAENDLKVSLGAIAADTLNIRAGIDYAARVLDQILLAGSAANARLDKMIATSERIAAASERSVSMNLYGTDPEIVAARIAQQLRLQGANG